MIRINLNIAIVDMTTVKSKGRSILMCGNSTATNASVAYEKDFFVKKVIAAVVILSGIHRNTKKRKKTARRYRDEIKYDFFLYKHVYHFVVVIKLIRNN